MQMEEWYMGRIMITILRKKERREKSNLEHLLLLERERMDEEGGEQQERELPIESLIIYEMKKCKDLMKWKEKGEERTKKERNMKNFLLPFPPRKRGKNW